MRYFPLFLIFLASSCQAPEQESKTVKASTYTYSQPDQQHVFWKNSYVYREEPAEALVQYLHSDSLAAGIRVNLFKENHWLMAYEQADSNALFIDAGDVLIRYMLKKLKPEIVCNFSDQQTALSHWKEISVESYRLRAEREVFEPLGIDRYRWQDAQLSLPVADYAYFLQYAFKQAQVATQPKMAACLGFKQTSVKASGRLYPVYEQQAKNQLLAYCPELKAVILLQCSRLQQYRQDYLIQLSLEAVGTL